MNESQFINPYLKPYQSFDGPDKNLYRAPASIDKDDYEFIRGIRPTSGTVQIVQAILWSKTVKLLKENGITDITKKSEFESLIANIVVSDGRGDGVRRSSTSGNGGEVNVRDVGRGTPSKGAGNPDVQDKQPDVKSGVIVKGKTIKGRKTT
jgi:hypothetical protein